MRPAARPALEGLEPRCLLSGSGALSPAALFHETLDAALDLGALSAGATARTSGVIGAGPATAADVNWYEFELSAPAEIRLTAQPGAGHNPLVAALSLYNDAPYDPFGPVDYFTPDGHRLLARDDAGTHGGAATLDRVLGAGNYWVAVSGSGDDNFHPFLADSGLSGSTGAYLLTVTAGDPGLSAADLARGVVLAADPAPGAVLADSPFAIRFDLSAPVDPTTLATDGSGPGAQLWALPANGQGAPQLLPMQPAAFEPVANELLLQPQAPLAPGAYQVVLNGYGPGGADYVLNFRVTGAGGTDTVTTATDLGDVSSGRLVRVSGAVGDDPTDPFPFDPAGVQMYHFRVSGSGSFSLVAEGFAGRIGSPLDAALTLFRAVPGAPAGTPPVFVASNDDTLNNTPATDGEVPLATDPALMVSLTAGDYYLAVSSSGNVPDPTDDPTRAPGMNGIFDPTQSHSGWAGSNTGPYVLNLQVRPAGRAPRVVAVTPDAGPDGRGPLTAIRVRFDQPVNLLPLAFTAFQQSLLLNGSPDGALSSVALVGADGTSHDVRLESYDGATNTATFVLPDGVPAGQYTLTLSGSGSQGITNLGGVPIAGNNPFTRDFGATISVARAGVDALSWASQPGHHDRAHAQDLGAFFPVALSEGVTVTRSAAVSGAVNEDDYRISLSQSRSYTFILSGAALPDGTTLSLIDAAGAVVTSTTCAGGSAVLSFPLSAGTYTVRVSGPASLGDYTLVFGDNSRPDNPTPLVIGPSPVLQVQLVTDGPGAAAAPAGDFATGGAPAPPVASPAALSNGPATPAPLGPAGGELLVQGFSPLNGIAAAGEGAAGPLLVRAPTPPAAAQSLLGLLVATQPALEDGAEAAPAPSPAPPSSTTGRVLPIPVMPREVLDTVFALWNALPTPAPAVAAPAVPAEATAAPAQVAAVSPVSEAAEPPVPTAPAGFRVASWGWASAAALAMMLVRERLKRPRSASETPAGQFVPALPATR